MEKKTKNESGKYFLISPHYFFVILVGLLLVFSVVQSFQISSIKTDMKESDALSIPTSFKSSGTQAALKSSTSSAPTMVGGC